MTDVTVASLNIRGIPLTGSRLAARCQAIGAFFETSDVDVACFQEVHTYAHLLLLTRQMRSFRHVSFGRALPGPAGDVVTFSRVPVASTTFHRFGPVAAPIPRLARLWAQRKGALTTTLTGPGYRSSTLTRLPTPTGTGRQVTGSSRPIAPGSAPSRR